MARSLALLAALAFGMSSGAAWAGGGDCGSLHVSKSSSTVASADGQSAPSTQIQLPKPKGG
jgi:hypothetical protein